MAHQIDFSNGRANIALRGGAKTAWHGFGVDVSANDTATWATAAGLDWRVIREKGYAANVRAIPDGIGGDLLVTDYIEIPGIQVFRRSDNNAILSTVGPNTHPLQNSEAFDFFQPFLDSNFAQLETAMALDEGRRVVVTAKITGGTSEIVKGDEIEKYIMLSNSHDGTLAVRVGYTPVRVVCANTLRAAIDNKASKLIRVRHGKDVVKNVRDIQATMDAINAVFTATEDQYRALASRRNINSKDLRNYVKAVFKMEEDAETGKLATRTQNVLDDILRLHDKRTGIVAEMLAEMKAREERENANHQLIGAAAMDAILNGFEAGKGTDIPDARNSWWTAYNAVTEHLTHSRGRSQENLINSNLFGANAETNKVALETAMVMSGLQSA